LGVGKEDRGRGFSSVFKPRRVGKCNYEEIQVEVVKVGGGRVGVAQWQIRKERGWGFVYTFVVVVWCVGGIGWRGV
jgi:hypothetical protein